MLEMFVDLDVYLLCFCIRWTRYLILFCYISKLIETRRYRASGPAGR